MFNNDSEKEYTKYYIFVDYLFEKKKYNANLKYELIFHEDFRL
jgi:hypothetical protein